MGVNSLPKAVIQCRDCDVNLGSPGCEPDV